MPALAELDAIWLDCAQRLELPVMRGGDAYVHFDGRALHLATDEHLDADDSIAQLVFHEICHLLVQGPEARYAPDWGLDNFSDADAVREQSALRLQAHLAGGHGLRDVMYPTTVVRPFYESLPARALGRLQDGDPSVLLAYAAADRAAKSPYAGALGDALSETARRLAVPLHPKSGYALAVVDECGTCVWRTASGFCRQASARRSVRAEERACVRYERELDCLECGACCRSAYDAVLVGARDPVRKRHPELIVVREDGSAEVRRAGDRCGALTDEYRCVIYDDRPTTCRDFERGGRHCITARRRVGLSL